MIRSFGEDNYAWNFLYGTSLGKEIKSRDRDGRDGLMQHFDEILMLVLAHNGLKAVRHLNNQEGDGSRAGGLQDRAQDADGALIVPVVEDEPEHLRVAVPPLRDGACVTAAVVPGSWTSCLCPKKNSYPRALP